MTNVDLLLNMSVCDDGPDATPRNDHRRRIAPTVTIQILGDDAVRTTHARWPASAGTATTACVEPAAQRQADSTSASLATSSQQ